MPVATPENTPSEWNARSQQVMLLSEIEECLKSHPLDEVSVYNADLEEIRVLSGRVPPSENSSERYSKPIHLTLICASGLVTLLRWSGTRPVARQNYDLGTTSEMLDDLDPYQGTADARLKSELGRAIFSHELSHRALNRLSYERTPITEDITDAIQALEARVFSL